MKKISIVILCLIIVCGSLTACFPGNRNLVQLPTPYITEIVNNCVYWTEVPNASSYIIRINNYQGDVGNKLQYDFTALADRMVKDSEELKLHIFVKAKGNQNLYSDSEWSGDYTYNYKKKSDTLSDPTNKATLATPVFSYDDINNLIEWDPIDGADGYEMLIDGQSIVIPQMTKCVYRPNIEADVDFTFSMRALAPENNSYYLDSNWTRVITLKFDQSGEVYVADQEAVNKAQELRIGYGYNFIDDEYFDVTKASANSILDLNGLFNSAHLNIQPSTYTKSESIYEDSISDFKTSVASSLSSELSIGGAFSIFSANVSLGLSSSSSIDFSQYGKSGFLNCYSYAEYKNYQVIDYGDYQDLASLFTDSFKMIVEAADEYGKLSYSDIAEYILRNYGTHLILGVKTGGRLDYYYSFATNNTKAASEFKKGLSANASAGIAGIISASTNNTLSGEFNDSVSKGDTENSSSFVIYGGSTEGISAANIGEKFLSWSSSINEENARSIGISRNGIMYLPTLISHINPNVGYALDSLIRNKAEAAYNKLLQQYKNAENFVDTSVNKLDDLVVYNDTIRSGEAKVAGSGRTCSAGFALNQSLFDLKKKGYTHLVINIDYDLREQDDCYIYVNLFDENNKSLYYRLVEHGGPRVNYSYASYTIALEIDLNELPSNKFRIEFKAENKIFKDFYVGTVKGFIYAVQKESQ